MELSLFLSVVSILIVVTNFTLSILDRGKKNQKENNQELIKYQLEELKNDYKAIASDIKEIRKMLDNYKETFRDMVKNEMEEHIRYYHKGDLKWI